jgi:hypothetical protein
MLTPSSIVLNGTRYEVTPFGSTKGRQVLVRLSNLLGPALAQALATPASGGTAKEALEKVSASALADLLGRVSAEDLEYLVREFAACTVIQAPDMKGPGPLDESRRDSHYAANYGELFQWLWFGITLNYKSFLAVVPVKFMAGPTSGSPAP